MDVAERIERLKLKAQVFLNENKKAFLKDIYDNWFFCYIKDPYVENGSKLKIKNFAGHRFEEDKIFEEIYWADVIDIREFQESGK